MYEYRKVLNAIVTEWTPMDGDISTVDQLEKYMQSVVVAARKMVDCG